ncbi:MAG: glycosyltransferase family 2 protein [Chloroflexota bacterium]
MSYFQRILDIIAPPGTTRRQLPDLCRQVIRVWRKEGMQAALRNIYHTIQEHGYGLLLGFGLVRPRIFVPPPSIYTYEDWIADHEPDAQALAEQSKLAASLSLHPTFSIVTPVYNPPADVFIETIESVLAQTYPHWKLYLTDGGSDDPQVLDAIEHYSQLDSRIQAIRLEKNLGISGNSNVALNQADGDFISLLDHDDLIAPNMLFEVASCLQDYGDQAGTTEVDNVPVDIVFFDEDKISDDGEIRRDPWLKPDFGPETLLANNILMHSVIRRSLLVDIGGFNSEMDGAQDWDVALRCSERTKRIAHIPKILYHWRQIEGSAARDINAKPWAFEAQERCIAAHLARIGSPDAKVTLPKLGQIRVRWPNHGERVSIIILTKDKYPLVSACVQSILQKTSYPNFEIILVDTGSKETKTHDFYRSLANENRVRIVERGGRFNFSAANNFGASYATGGILLFLNNDTEVLHSDWLEEMVGWARRSEIGAVGAMLSRPDETLQHVGVIMGLGGHADHIYDGCPENTYGSFGLSNWLRNYYAVTGACLMMRKTLFDDLLGFDELYEMVFNDIDLCLRAAQNGYRNVCTPFAHLLHHEGMSRGVYFPLADLIRATLQMWPIIRDGDPHFNANLSYFSKVPVFASPNEPSKAQHMLEIWQMFQLIPSDLSPEAITQNPFHDSHGNLPRPPLWHEFHPGTPSIKSWDEITIPESRLLLVMPCSADSDVGKAAMSHAQSLIELGIEVVVCLDDILSAEPDPSPTIGSTNTDFPLTDPSSTRASGVDITSNGMPNAFSKQVGQAELEIHLVPGLLNDGRIATWLFNHDGQLGFDGLILYSIECWKLIHAARAFNLPTQLWLFESTQSRQLLKEDRHVADAVAYAQQVYVESEESAIRLRSHPLLGDVVIQ